MLLLTAFISKGAYELQFKREILAIYVAIHLLLSPKNQKPNVFYQQNLKRNYFLIFHTFHSPLKFSFSLTSDYII